MAELVSVLIAAHNGEATVERAVRSALGQTYEAVDVIVVDDASTDGTWDILTALASADDRVSLHRRSEPSGGPAAPRNIGLAHARGRFAALLDQDDQWLPEKLAKQVPLFADSSVGVVYSNCFRSSGGTYFDWEFYAERRHALGTEPRSMVRWNFVPTCTAVWRNSEGRKFDEGLSSVDDRDFWVRMALDGWGFAVVDEPLAIYNTEGPQLSNDTKLSADLSLSMWRQLRADYPEDSAVAKQLGVARDRAVTAGLRHAQSVPVHRRPAALARAVAASPSTASRKALRGLRRVAVRRR